MELPGIRAVVLIRYEEDPMTGGYGFEAPPAMDSFTAADPYADYELPVCVD